MAPLPPLKPGEIADVEALSTQAWLELSVALKADREADRTFGWVLEMWGCAPRRAWRC